MLKTEWELVYLRENCISKEICNEIIEKFEISPRKYYGVTSGGGYDKSKKNTIDFNIPICSEDVNTTEYEKELWLSHSEVITKTLGKHLQIYSEIVDNKYKGIRGMMNLFTEVYLFHKYIKGEGGFVDHSDNEISKHEGSRVKERMLTFLFYLNDVEEGGETIIGNDIKIKPKAGSLLIFPASWTYPHRGETPLSSDKYIITGWLHRVTGVDFSNP